MACNIETIKASACSSGIGKIDNPIVLMQVIAQSSADTLAAINPATDISFSAIQARACVSGIGKESNPIVLMQVIAQSLCEIAEAATIEAIVDSFVARSGISDEAQIAALTVLVTNARANGWWDKCDLIYPYVGGDATAHSQNLKSSSFPITWNGTVTHDANGITGDGATGYGDTGYDPSVNGVQYQLNSASGLVYRRNLVPGGLFGTEVNARFLAQVGGGASLNYGANSSASDNVSGVVALGLVGGSRHNSTGVSIYRPSIESALVRASTVLSSGNVVVLATRDPGGVTGNFSASNLAFFTVGADVDFAMYQVMQTDIQTFQTALGRQV